MAKKTGFYARQFSQAEARDLQEAGQRGLLDEIALVRVAMRRTIELADGVSELPEMVQALKALSSAAGRLAGLLRTQDQVASSHRPELADLLNQELAALAADYRLSERFLPAKRLTAGPDAAGEGSLPPNRDQAAAKDAPASTGDPVNPQEASDEPG